MVWLIFLAGLLNFFLGLLIVSKSRSKESRYFILFIVCTVILIIFDFIFRFYPNLFILKSAYAFAGILPGTALLFAYFFVSGKITKIKSTLILFPSLLLFILSYIPDLIIKKINVLTSLGFKGENGILFPYYSLIIGVYLLLTIYVIFRGIRRAQGLRKLQMRYVLFGLIGYGLSAMFFSLLLPTFFDYYDLTLLDAPSSLIFVAFVTYSITRYRLLNVRFVLTKSVLYFLMIGLVSSFFVFTTFLTTSVFDINYGYSGNIALSLLASIVIVVFIDPLKKLLSRVTDDIFYKGKIEYEQVLEKISRILAQEIDLELLLNKVKQGIETEVKIKKVDVWVKMSDKFYTFSEKSPVEGTFEPEFISYLQKENNLIVTEELKRQLYDLPEGAARSQLEKMASIIDRLHWEMAIPVTNKGDVTAILGLHHKLSGDIYTGEEINFFGIVASQLAVAIEKSKYYEEVQQAREDLQVKVDRATLRLRQNNIDLEARNKFLTTTQNISNLISRSLEIKNIIQVIADSISSELGYIGGILSFADAEKKFLYAAAITRSEAGMKALSMLPRPANEYKSSVKNKDNLGVKIFISGQAMTGSKLSDFLSPPVEKDVMDKIQLTLGVQTVVGVPIYAENEIIGVIDYLLAVPEAQISKLDMEMMNNLADQIGIVYRNVKLYQELEGANKELQQANFHLMQLDKAKSEFLSIASHQLRTPVSAIKGYLSMMIEGDFGVVKPEQKKIITDVFESASRLARTINVFLNVSRIEAGRFKLTKAPIDMNTVTEGVIKELKQQAAIKNVKLEWLPPAKPCTIIVDGDKVREVVLNLVDNSIKYTQEGFVRVTQDMTPTEFHFQVTDSGMGILPEEVGTLFKKFVRGTGVAQVNTSGSGLGLYIAQRVVKEHGGKIWVESPGVGKGSTFQFTIPIEIVISDKVQSKEMIESTEAKPLTESKEKK